MKWALLRGYVDMTAHVTRDESRDLGASERSALRDSSELE